MAGVLSVIWSRDEPAANRADQRVSAAGVFVPGAVALAVTVSSVPLVLFFHGGQVAAGAKCHGHLAGGGLAICPAY